MYKTWKEKLVDYAWQYAHFFDEHDTMRFSEKTTWESWKDYLITTQIFKKKDIVVKGLSYLLIQYFMSEKFSVQMPRVYLEELLVPEDSSASDTAISTRLLNAINTIKKSPHAKSVDSSKTGKFITFSLNYVNLTRSEITLLPDALFTFLKIPESYRTLFEEGNSVINYKKGYGEEYDPDALKPPLGRIIEPKFGLEKCILSPDTKKEIDGYITSIKNRVKLLEWGVNYFPKLLLAGTIGTGKSMTAEAIAHELDMKIYRVGNEDIVGQYLGETAKNISTAVQFAYKHNSKLVLFIDEIEGLVGKRSGLHQAIARAVNTFLSLLEENKELLLIAASNHAHKIDKAALSRFTKKIWFELPSVEMINEIIVLHIGKLPIAEDVDLHQLSGTCYELEFTGRDIRNLIVEFTQEMLEENADELTNDTLQKCLSRIRNRSDFEERSYEYSEYLKNGFSTRPATNNEKKDVPNLDYLPDDTDLVILDFLIANENASFEQMAELLPLSKTAIYHRFQKLKETGYVQTNKSGRIKKVIRAVVPCYVSKKIKKVD